MMMLKTLTHASPTHPPEKKQQALFGSFYFDPALIRSSLTTFSISVPLAGVFHLTTTHLPLLTIPLFFFLKERKREKCRNILWRRPPINYLLARVRSSHRSGPGLLLRNSHLGTPFCGCKDTRLKKAAGRANAVDQKELERKMWAETGQRWERPKDAWASLGLRLQWHQLCGLCKHQKKSRPPH